jgi:RNA polymerase sigma factor for flagellar operon FliA
MSASTRPPDVDLLWKNYEADRERENRDALILAYMNLVRYVASKVGQGLPQNVEQADLVSYGTFGLIDAIEKFEPERGFKFETYAIARIKGAILDELRSMDWVPRSVRAKARAVDVAVQELEGQLHRSPTGGEVADSLGLTDRQYRDTVGQMVRTGVTPLDEHVNTTESLTVGDMVAEEHEASRNRLLDNMREMQECLADNIEIMPFRERVVITLYYYEGLTLAEIGTVLGVTESRVCQIHTKAIENLQEELGKLAP